MVDRDVEARSAIHVLIVDDHTMFAESIARLFEREPGMVVAGVADTSAKAIEIAAQMHPDVAVVDYGLPDADGVRTAAGIRAVSADTNVLILTGLADDGVATAAIQAGCSGFLTKDKAARELVAAVRLVHEGEAYIGQNHLVDLRRGLALEKMKSEFLARIGHEFRTPLTMILGYGRLLARRDMTCDNARELGAQIVESGERLERIVEILEFSASSASGQLKVHPSGVDADALIDEAVSRWASRLDKTHSIEHLSPGSPVGVMADERWLTMAVDELIDNAVKFSPAGGTVVITARRSELSGLSAVEIAVGDEGVGMSPAARIVAFEEFMQVDSSDSRPFGGLGLGLSLVRGVALAHGGAVSCASVDPMGTRVAITIPVATAPVAR
jgi:signal transduction histidine kinase